MEQDEVIKHHLINPNGAYTKKLLDKKGIKEPVYLRMVKAKNGTWFGTNEPFESPERDKELAEAWLLKRNTLTRVF